MITSPALNLSSTVPVMGVLIDAEPVEGLEIPDFGALLAQTAVPDAAPADTPASAQPVQPDSAAAVMAAPQPANTGKILPSILPDTLPLESADQPAKAQPAPTKPNEVPIAALLGRLRTAQPRKTDDPAAPTAPADLPEGAEASDVTPPDLAVAINPAPALPDLALPTPPRPGDNETPPLAAPSALPQRSGQEPAQLPVQIVQPVLAHRPAQAQPHSQPRPAPAETQEQAPAEQAQPGPPPLTQVRLEVAMPEPLRSARPLAPRAPLALAASLIEDSEPAAAPTIALAALQALQQPAAPLANAAPLTRPHDFTALIDRLAAAREAAQPQLVSVSLPHADFGRVQLHFRQDDGALAVSLASNDPDFARIAAQAAPPVLPLGETRSFDSAGGQSGARGEDHSAATPQGNSERRQSGERRSDAEARFDHQPRSRAPSDRGERRSGIFA